MQVKEVPWWRKALKLALSGIRTGFGFFAKAPKENAAIKPDFAVRNEEINKEIREEAELTKNSPEENPTVDIAGPIHAPTAETSSGAVIEQMIDPVNEIAAPDSETDASGRTPPSTEAAVAVLEDGEVPVPNEETPELATVDAVAEPIVESAVAAPIEPVAEVIQEVVPAPSPEPAAIEAGMEPAIELAADEIVQSAYAEDEAPAPLPAIQVEQENVEISGQLPVPEASVPQAETVPMSAEPELGRVFETQSAEAETAISTEPEAEGSSEEVTDPTVPVENDSVDEMAAQAESAISEVAEYQAASPVLETIPELASQPEPDATPESMIEQIGAKQVEELVPVLAGPGADDEIAQPGEQSIEPVAEEQYDEINNAETADAQVVSIEPEQTIAEHMDVNQTNPEPIEENVENVPSQEFSPETPSPVEAPENSAATQDASAPAPTAQEEPEEPGNVTIATPHPAKPFIKRESPEDQANASPFSVIVSEVYDGPLDLLLDLIRKQDIDIYDIPIARITAQFLAYVDKLKATDVDVAGEFIYTASLLIHIKSKMLLPRAPSGPEDAAEDPRRELVERLLEHERFKNAAQMLQQKQMLEAATWTNPGVRDFKEDAGAEPEIAADTVDLVRVFRDILDRARNRPVLNVEEDAVTVGQMIQFLSRRLNMEDKPVALRRLLSHTRSERALIAMFLALLELVRLQAILLRQDLAFSEIFIKKHSNFESVMNQGVAQDDWK